MKYVVILTLCVLSASCSNLLNADAPHCELANNAIDSIIVLNGQMELLGNAAKLPENRNTYLRIVVDRYAFARMYQVELHKIKDEDKKEKIMSRYISEVRMHPNTLFPYEIADSVNRELDNWQ